MPAEPPEPSGSSDAASSPVDWDAESYHRVSDMQFEWGKRFVERLSFNGDEVILDAGCGTGRVTELLRERVPRGRIIGVDASPSMIEQARETLGDDVELFVCDLLELRLTEPVDVVFSTSTFHWILDHDELFAVLYAALKPGGRLLAQCGGAGNVEELTAAIGAAAREAPFAAHLRGYEHPWLFPSAGETTSRLESAGFEDVRCAPEKRNLELDEPREWHRTVGATVQLAQLPEELHEPFLEAVLARLEDPARLSLIRLNIEARRPER